MDGDSTMSNQIAEISANYTPSFNSGIAMQAIRDGLPTRFAKRLMQTLDISKKEMLNLLAISSATFDRRMKGDKFISAESDRLYRIANLAIRAEEVLGTTDKAKSWIHKPNRALSGDSPLSRLDTEVGYQQSLDLLSRIEYGVYS